MPESHRRDRTAVLLAALAVMTVIAAMFAAALLGTSAPVLANAGGGSGGEPSEMEQAREAIEAQRYDEAIATLETLDADDADVRNLLGYAHRLAGRLEQALAHYTRALEIDPEHKGANEYLGELYLQMDELAKAEERLAVLDDACFFPCSEYRELEQAIADYRKARGL